VAGLCLNLSFGCVVRRVSDLQLRHSGQPGMPHFRKGLFVSRTLKRRIDNAALTLPFSPIGYKTLLPNKGRRPAPIWYDLGDASGRFFKTVLIRSGWFSR
jgi:hypothetical protein